MDRSRRRRRIADHALQPRHADLVEALVDLELDLAVGLGEQVEEVQVHVGGLVPVAQKHLEG